MLAGFQHARVSEEKKANLLSASREASRESSLIIVTIELENAAPGLGAQR